ncbi:class III signal peptide-containing protein [Thermococcus sp.]
MRRVAQTALEYLFMVAAVLILVAIATKVILDSLKSLKQGLTVYTREVRKVVLENL